MRIIKHVWACLAEAWDSFRFFWRFPLWSKPTWRQFKAASVKPYQYTGTGKLIEVIWRYDDGSQEVFDPKTGFRFEQGGQ